MKNSGFKMKGWSPFHQDKAKLTEQKTKQKVDLLRTAGTTTNPPKYFKLVDGKKISISAEEYKSSGESKLVNTPKGVKGPKIKRKKLEKLVKSEKVKL